MTGQRSLFPSGPLARRTDPVTSKQAAPSQPHLSWLQQEVLAALTGSDGLTDEEITAAVAGYQPTVVKRRSELVRAGLVEASGRFRATSRGRDAIVWRVT